MDSERDGPRAIGGVMPASPEGPPAAASLLRVWSKPWAYRGAFASARAALAALLAARDIRRLWLPAYACPVLADAARAAGAALKFYRVSPDLGVRLDAVEAEATAGDAVLVIAFFGRPVDDATLELRRRRPDLLWIEDRAQAADGGPAWADAVIYSPRKLVGVGDGGLLFSNAPTPAPSEPAADLWGPEDARAGDPDGDAPASWYALFQDREARMSSAPAAMSARSLAALETLAAAPMASARRSNWRTLAERLGDRALWPIRDPTFTPLAFPIVVPDAAAMVAALAAEWIWAPRHWPALPSPADAFPEAHALAGRLVSLPCDQRYGAADMERIARAVLRFQPR